MNPLPAPQLLFRMLVVGGGGVSEAPWFLGGGGGRRVALGSFGTSKVGGPAMSAVEKTKNNVLVRVARIYKKKVCMHLCDL